MSFVRNYKAQLFLVGALVAVLALAVLGSFSFQRKVAEFQPVGFSLERVDSSWHVVDAPGTETGLRAGDQLLSIDQGGAPREWKALAALLREQAETELIVLRDGLPQSVTYQRPTQLNVDFVYLVLASVGIVYLLIGLYTAYRDRQSHARLFCIWTLLSAAVYVLSPSRIPVDRLDELTYVLDQLGRTFLPAVTLHLFMVFPARLSGVSRLAISAVYAPSLVLAAYHIDAIFFGGQVAFGAPTAIQIAFIDRIELFLLVSFSLASALVLLVRSMRRPSWIERRQVQWIVLGMLGGYIPFLALYLVPHTFSFDWPAWTEVVAVVPLALVPLGFAWAILRYKLLEIGLILRDSIAYTLTVFVGMCGFAIVNQVVERTFPAGGSLSQSLVMFAAGIMIAGVMVPAKGAIGSTLDRFRLGSGARGRRLLTELGDELLHIRDTGELCRVLRENLEESLVVRARFYVSNEDSFELIEATDPHIVSSLRVEDFGQDFWHRPVTMISTVALPSAEESRAQQLYVEGFRYVFPLEVRGYRVGVVVLGYKFDEEPMDAEDLDLVRGLLNQAALAIENGKLLDEVRSRLDQVVELEQYTEGIIQSSPAGIAVLDRDRHVVSANDAFRRLVGGDQKTFEGETIESLLPIAPLPEPDGELLEVSYCELSGEEHYFQLSVAPYPRQDLRVLVLQDVSDRVAMEIELRDKDRMASLGMLAAGVAHEVNTPLTGISSYAQLLLADAEQGQPAYEILKKMERQTFRAAQIVNNLLDFARNRRDEIGRVDLDAVLRECVQLSTERARGAGVEVLIADRPATAASALVNGNEGELHQVFTNLIVNAIDAMSGSGGRVTVEVECSGERVRTRVDDEGPGIPEARRERVFQPFFSSKGSGGTGLGLAITRNIINRHGGTIRVESRSPGNGTSFIVDLPAYGLIRDSQ